jgi:hypothetical protein
MRFGNENREIGVDASLSHYSALRAKFPLSSGRETNKEEENGKAEQRDQKQLSKLD